MDNLIIINNFYQNDKTFIKGFNIYLIVKIVKYKLYSNLKALFIETHCLKDLSIGFMIKLSISHD